MISLKPALSTSDTQVLREYIYLSSTQARKSLPSPEELKEEEEPQSSSERRGRSRGGGGGGGEDILWRSSKRTGGVGGDGKK